MAKVMKAGASLRTDSSKNAIILFVSFVGVYSIARPNRLFSVAGALTLESWIQSSDHRKSWATCRGAVLQMLDH